MYTNSVLINYERKIMLNAIYVLAGLIGFVGLLLVGELLANVFGLE
jgi:hypothetical protein